MKRARAETLDEGAIHCQYGQPIINTAPQQVSFVVSSVAGGAPRNLPVGRGVTVTPLATTQHPTIARTQQIQKVLLKAVAKHDKKKAKTFTLRNINVADVDTCSRLKALIRAQLREDVTASEFDVGFISGTNVVSVRSEEDLAEIWSNQLKGDRIVLWCDGLACSGPVHKRKKITGSDSDDSDAAPNPKLKKKTRDREDRVQDILDKLKKQHGDRFTIMQYRIWSEMVAGGMHGTTSEPPTTSMFVRAGSTLRKLQQLP